MKEYNSIEEFVFLNKRSPDIDESGWLHNLLWSRYVESLHENERQATLENMRLGDIDRVSNKIEFSIQRFASLFRQNRNILAITYNQQRDADAIYVTVNSIDSYQLYKFRDIMPNFFEGWEVKLIPVMQANS